MFKPRQSRRSGQAMLEYALVTLALLGLVGALSWFVHAARAQGDHVSELVGSEYP